MMIELEVEEGQLMMIKLEVEQQFLNCDYEAGGLNGWRMVIFKS